MFRYLRERRDSSAKGDDGFALVYAVLIILVVSGLATAILGLVVAQVRPTQLARKRQQTLNSAEAGLQSALGRIRASTGASGAGLLSALPQCAKNSKFAVVSGNVDGTGDSYTSSVYYFSASSNPAGLTPANVVTAPGLLYCSPLNSQPGYAYVVSAGVSTAYAGKSVQTGDRTLHAVYQFSTSNTPVFGGRIKEYTQNLCWDVGSTPTPAAGTPVTLQTCQAGSFAPQSWVYEPNLTLKWTGNADANLCLQTLSGANGQPVLLQSCVYPAPTAPYGYASATAQLQEFGFNDSGHFAGAANDGNVNGSCIGTVSTTPPAGAPLILQACTSSTSDYQAYNPDASAGAGAATGITTGYPGTNGQMVNFQEFGRCIDLTGQQIGAAYDIDYPCKQTPDGTKVTFNQRFKFTAVSGNLGTLSTNNSSGYYCLTANGFNADGTSKSTNFQPCNGQATAASVGTGDTLTTQQWTFTGALANDYPNSYNVKTVYNGQPYCLSITGSGPGFPDSTWSSQIMETCNGSNRQKWNAPSVPFKASLTGLTEDVDH